VARTLQRTSAESTIARELSVVRDQWVRMAESPPKGRAMRKILNKKSGFTLIELMIVVAILGILAAIAIPAFVQYVRRSKSAEAVTNVDNMFKLAASYYNPTEKQEQGLNGTQFTNCTVASGSDGKTPGATKSIGIYTGSTFGQAGLGFSVEYAYYSYSLATTPTPGCGGTANQVLVYQLRAIGNLDGDTTSSLFEQATGTNGNNEMYRARGFYIQNETE
jgi:type IV pilus assembly protein PilA